MRHKKSSRSKRRSKQRSKHRSKQRSKQRSKHRSKQARTFRTCNIQNERITATKYTSVGQWNNNTAQYEIFPMGMGNRGVPS